MTEAPTTPAGEGACDSCGLEVDDLAAVRRVYLDADEHGELRVADTDDEIEAWCASCRSHYPHIEVEPAARTDPGHHTGG